MYSVQIQYKTVPLLHQREGILHYVRVNYQEWRLFARYIPWDVSGKEPPFSVINSLVKI